MSRIGKKPITVPAGVTVKIADGQVSVEGKSKLSMPMPPYVGAELKDGQVVVSCIEEAPEASAMQGLARSLINNMIIGVSTGFKKELLIVGVGYKAAVAGQKLTLTLGFSHPIIHEVPAGVKVTVTDNVKLLVEGADKQAVGETAACIRRYRKPEPYKGKGIRYVDEQIILKEGKSVG